MMLIGDKVLILKCGRMGGTSLNKATEGATLEIIDARDVILVIKTQSVSHQNKMYLFVVLHLNGVDTIDSGKK